MIKVYYILRKMLYSTASKSEDKQKTTEDKPPSPSPRLGGIGPALPPGFVLNRPDTEDSSSSSSDSASDEDEPRPQTSQAGIGPALPPGFVPPDLGPTPSYKDDSSEDEGYGPVPHKGPQIEISAAEEFEMRAERMKNKLLKKVRQTGKRSNVFLFDLFVYKHIIYFPLEYST